MLMVSDKERVNIFTTMEIDMKEILEIIRNMELENLHTLIKANIMVICVIFRTMVKWSKTWRRSLYIC